MISHASRRVGFATMSIVACAVVAACSSSDFLEPSVRQPAWRQATVLITHQEIAVPAYFEDWSGMLADAPPANLIILNPNDGPDPGYTSQVSAAHANGARVLGYVLTGWASRSSTTVKADIDRYYSLYPDVDGIFLDEATSDCTHAQSYYQPLHDYIKASHPNATIVINPGTNVPSCYLSVADIVVTFESSFAEYQNAWTTENREWETPANAGRIWHIIHTASSAQLSTALQLSRARNAGYVFVTSFTETQNTYGALPTYFHSEASDVNAFNGSSGGGGGTTALSRWRGSNDGVNEHYTLHFSHPFEYYRVYIDSDHSAATGYAVAGIGADYLVEDDILYSHGAAGWNWNQIGGVGEVLTATSVDWTVPRSAIGETAYPNSASLSFEAETIGGPVENTGSYEHVYTPSTGTITGYFAENDASNVYYQANFTTAYAYKHVYIDTDANAATGYAYGGIGANYMIENNQLYRHAGGGWNWTLIASTPATGGSTGIKRWTVPRATLGETATSGEVANIVFDGSDGVTDHAAPIYRHVYTR